MWWKYVIVGVIVAAAGLGLAGSLYRKLTGRAGCSCGSYPDGCARGGTCGARRFWRTRDSAE